MNPDIKNKQTAVPPPSAESRYGDLVMAFDREKKVVYCRQPKKGKIFFLGKAIQGQTHAELFSKEIDGKFQAAFLLCRQGREAQYEFHYGTGGEASWFAADMKPTQSKGEFSGVILVVRDISKEKRLKEEYQISRVMADNLVEMANVLIVNLDKDGRIVLFNSFAEKLSGYKKEEVLGKNWFLLFIPEAERERMKKIFSDVVEDNRNYSVFENAIKTKSGEEKLISWNNTLLYDTERRLRAVLSIGTDISERKKYEESLKESEAEKIKILNLIPQAVFKMEKRVITFANASVETVFGFRPDELIGCSSRVLYRDSGEFDEIGELSYPILEKNQVFKAEYYCRKKSGEDMICNIYAIKTDKISGSQKVVVAFEDISEKKKALDEIKSTKERYESLYEDAPGSYITVGVGRKILRLNRTAEKIFCYQREEIIGKDLLEIMAHDEESWKKLNSILIEARIRAVDDQELTIKDRVGREVWVSLTVRFAKDKKTGREKWHLVIIDINQRKEAELRYQKKHEELVQINRLMVGRELKMIELKNRIKELEQKSHENNDRKEL